MELQFHPGPARKLTYTIAECTVNKLLLMDRGTVRNVQNFIPEQICEISASSWFYYKENLANKLHTNLKRCVRRFINVRWLEMICNRDLRKGKQQEEDAVKIKRRNTYSDDGRQWTTILKRVGAKKDDDTWEEKS